MEDCNSQEKKRRSPLVLFIETSMESSNVEDVEKLRAFHVSRLKSSTTTYDLLTFENKLRRCHMRAFTININRFLCILQCLFEVINLRRFKMLPTGQIMPV